MAKTSLIKPPSNALEIFPDSDRYKCIFTIASASSGRVYKVSFDTAQGAWVCSCPGCIRHGQCKHLDAMGRKGRKYGKNFADAKLLGVSI
jgi:hypothetical protein